MKLFSKIVKISEQFDRSQKFSDSDRCLIIAASKMSNLGQLVPKKLDSIFREAGAQLFVVGGSVRDSLLGFPAKDVDLCTNLKPEEIIQVLESNNLKALPLGIEHGTITTLLNGEPVEITSFRIDTNPTGRHSEVQFVDSLEQDLARRDFTINSMAVDSQGNVVDPFNGQEDLAKGIIKAVGNPENRLREDFLRIIRALRFSSRYNFNIEEKTRQAIEQLAPVLRSEMRINNPSGAISTERITDEINKAFKSGNSGEFLKNLANLGVLTDIFPEIENWQTIFEMVDRLDPQNKWFGLFINIPSDQIEEFVRRLKLPLDILQNAMKASDLKDEYIRLSQQSNISDQEIRNIRNKFGNNISEFKQIFEGIFGKSDFSKKIFDENQTIFQPMLQGRDLMPLFPERKPGRWVGDMLKQAEEYQRQYFEQTGEYPSYDEMIEFAKGKTKNE